MLYAFRIVQEDNTISHHGMVTGRNMMDIMVGIDQFVDPNAVQLKKISSFGCCFKIEEITADNDAEFVTFTPSLDNELELSEEYSGDIDEPTGWYFPNWKRIKCY
jgi:hypothetical protein